MRHKLLTLYQQNLSRYPWEMKHFSGIFQTILYDNKITWQIYNLWSSSLKELFKSFPKSYYQLKERTFIIIINNTSLRKKKGKKKRSVRLLD